MAYKEMLDEIINKSNLSIKDIALSCKEFGVNITSSYISQLRTGSQKPPSEEVSRAIAMVCGGNADKLILEAYLEKAPESITKFIRNSYHFFNILNDRIEDINDILENDLDENILSSFILEVNSLDMKNYDKSDKKQNSIFQILNMPRLIEDFNKSILNYGVNMSFDSKDPYIPKGSRLKIVPYEENIEPNHSDILLIDKPNSLSKQLVRYYNKNGVISIIPLDLSSKLKLQLFNSFTELKKVHNIYGKLVSYIVDL